MSSFWAKTTCFNAFIWRRTLITYFLGNLIVWRYVWLDYSCKSIQLLFWVSNRAHVSLTRYEKCHPDVSSFFHNWTFIYRVLSRIDRREWSFGSGVRTTTFVGLCWSFSVFTVVDDATLSSFFLHASLIMWRRSLEDYAASFFTNFRFLVGVIHVLAGEMDCCVVFWR